MLKDQILPFNTYMYLINGLPLPLTHQDFISSEILLCHLSIYCKALVNCSHEDRATCWGSALTVFAECEEIFSGVCSKGELMGCL